MSEWKNTTGYELVKVRDERVWLFITKAIYRVTIAKDALTYIADDGAQYRAALPGTSYESDMGSVPLVAQWIVAKDAFLKSFLFHDAGWTFGGLWISRDGGASWYFVPMHRTQLNALLYDMVRPEGCDAIRAWLIYQAVQIGALCSHDPHQWPVPTYRYALHAAYRWSGLDGRGNGAAMLAVKRHVAANPVCGWCGNARIQELTAHHIVPVSQAPEMSHEDYNLVTLCAKTCHFTVGHMNNWRHVNTVLVKQLHLMDGTHEN